MKWSDVTEKHMFGDGSQVTQIHDTVKQNCFAIKIKEGTITLSEDHYLLCDVKKVKKGFLKTLLTYAPKYIPRAGDVHIWKEEGGYRTTDEVTEWDDVWVDKKKNLIWLDVRTIHYLYKVKQNVRLATSMRGNTPPKTILSIDWVKEKDCFCVSTDTGYYKTCGIIHHNSVTLRNVLFHSLTHSDDIKLALVDLKISEFARFKDMDSNKVVGVANSVPATAKLLRMAREVMYKRNQQNSDRGLTDFADFKPEGPTNIIRIFGREFDENEQFQVEVGGQQKTMTAKEILEYMEGQE